MQKLWIKILCIITHQDKPSYEYICRFPTYSNQFLYYNSVDLQITNGPSATSSVCISGRAEINCGFQGANPNDVEVIWYVTRKNSQVMMVRGSDITTHTNGLQWVLDISSGNDRSPNSKLIVGPVSEDYDQSTYQCHIGLPGENKISSVIETLTVIGTYDDN